MLLFLVILRAFYPSDHTVVQSSTTSNYTVQAYNSSDQYVELDCAYDEEIKPEQPTTMKKIWRKDGQDFFKTSNIIFVENNRSIRFSNLSEEDSGIYSCCVKSTEDKPFKCFDRSLIVLESTDDAIAHLLGSDNGTEGDGNETVWSVELAYDHLLKAREGDTYFVKLFEVNATDIYCQLDGTAAQIDTAEHFPPQFGDILIRNFNSSIHTGTYACNATYTHENMTEKIETKFTVVESSQPNIHEKLLDFNMVAEFLTQACSTRSFVKVIFIVFLYLM